MDKRSSMDCAEGWRTYTPPVHLQKYFVRNHFVEGAIPLKVTRWVRYCIIIDYGQEFHAVSDSTGQIFSSPGLRFNGISMTPKQVKYPEAPDKDFKVVTLELNPLYVADLLSENMLNLCEQSVEIQIISALKNLDYLYDVFHSLDRDAIKITILNNVLTK